jgi:hypothetical protein
MNLNIKPSSLAQLISIPMDLKSPLDALASIRALGPILGENPNFLQFKRRKNGVRRMY